MLIHLEILMDYYVWNTLDVMLTLKRTRNQANTKCAKIPTADVHWGNTGEDLFHIKLNCVISEKVLSTNQIYT